MALFSDVTTLHLASDDTRLGRLDADGMYAEYPAQTISGKPVRRSVASVHRIDGTDRFYVTHPGSARYEVTIVAAEPVSIPVAETNVTDEAPQRTKRGTRSEGTSDVSGL